MIGATIVLLVAHAIIPRLRRASAADRHLFWSAALATAAMVPAGPRHPGMAPGLGRPA